MKLRLRSRRGSAITETGPALFVLLLLIFFPLIDLLGIAANYCFCFLMHNAELREIALRRPIAADASQGIQRVDNEFTRTAFANFLKLSSSDVTHVGPTWVTHPDNSMTVQLQTRVVCEPFLRIPFFVAIPGLSADMPFTFSTTRPQEELGRDPGI
ncbi:MAG: hypothetical protein U0105_07120 [Candidatus Obscuribacterales bacterium]